VLGPERKHPRILHGTALSIGIAPVDSQGQEAYQKDHRQGCNNQQLPLLSSIQFSRHPLPPQSRIYWTGQLLLEGRVRLSCALNGARDNAEMEAFNGRFKTEGRSLCLEAHSLSELRTVVGEQMRYYNNERRHSSLSYLPRVAYLERIWPEPKASG